MSKSVALQSQDSPLEGIMRGLKSDRPGLKCGALRQIRRMGAGEMRRHDLDRQVLPMLDDPDADVQENALCTIAELGSNGSAYAHLVGAKLEKSTEKQVQRAALAALASIGQDAAEYASAVESFLDSQDPDLVVDACTTLGSLK
ncbi:unnamed protein product, partial [Polarella glacialis]